MSQPKRVEDRSRQANWAHEQKAAGNCPTCGESNKQINPRTGKPYYQCEPCRKVTAAAKKLLMRDRRAAGIAD